MINQQEVCMVTVEDCQPVKQGRDSNKDRSIIIQSVKQRRDSNGDGSIIIQQEVRMATVELCQPVNQRSAVSL